jgi:hypothetical protein
MPAQSAPALRGGDPARGPRRGRQSLPRGPARESADVRESASADQRSGPDAAVSWANRAVPTLTGVGPVVYQADLDGVAAQWAALQANDPTPLVLPLFGTVLPDPGQEGSLGERLTRALNAAAPLTEVTVHVQNRDGQLIVQAAAHQDGVVSLGRLHAALWAQDPRLLPGVLAALEDSSSPVMPVLGPRAAAEIAEYWHNTDHLLELGLPEHLGRDEPLELSERQAIRLARRFGLPHARQVQDATPWQYFRKLLTLPEVLAQLEALPEKWEKLKVLGPLLAQLAEAQGALPELSVQEASEVHGLLIPHTFLTVSRAPYGIAEETVDEFVRNHWESGEEDPQYVLHVDTTAESHARLAAYLRHAPVIERLCEAIVDLLTALDEDCSAGPTK